MHWKVTWHPTASSLFWWHIFPPRLSYSASPILGIWYSFLVNSTWTVLGRYGSLCWGTNIRTFFIDSDSMMAKYTHLQNKLLGHCWLLRFLLFFVLTSFTFFSLGVFWISLIPSKPLIDNYVMYIVSNTAHYHLIVFSTWCLGTEHGPFGIAVCIPAKVDRTC